MFPGKIKAKEAILVKMTSHRMERTGSVIDMLRFALN